MTNNTEGLSPTLMAQIGVGWNRPLPAPFGFGNGIQPDGVNDYITIPSFSGKDLADIMPLTFEIWTNGTPIENYGIYWITFKDGTPALRLFTQSGMLYFNKQQTPLNPISTPGVTAYAVSQYSSTSAKLYVNGRDAINFDTYGSNPVTGEINSFAIFLGTAGRYFNMKADEIRIYNRIYTALDSRYNYNDGIGENPSNTDGLIAWFRFEQFENLDFSAAQDNSDIRLGIRDHSNNNNHAQPINMDTNPLSPNYVLKPFI